MESSNSSGRTMFWRNAQCLVSERPPEWAHIPNENSAHALLFVSACSLLVRVFASRRRMPTHERYNNDAVNRRWCCCCYYYYWWWRRWWYSWVRCTVLCVRRLENGHITAILWWLLSGLWLNLHSHNISSTAAHDRMLTQHILIPIVASHPYDDGACGYFVDVRIFVYEHFAFDIGQLAIGSYHEYAI